MSHEFYRYVFSCSHLTKPDDSREYLIQALPIEDAPDLPMLYFVFPVIEDKILVPHRTSYDENAARDFVRVWLREKGLEGITQAA